MVNGMIERNTLETTLAAELSVCVNNVAKCIARLEIHFKLIQKLC